MSEGDVSLIRDEDTLRRMWQQTEDFSKKKEIRAHMYRLREERLRNLYSPEPTQGKGCESAMHVSSLLDQSFQGLKRQEVRDAGSPPQDYGADLKELSNAGWNVESENRMTDDGHTQIRGVRADIQGRYDVEGGQGQFAAVDQHRRARTQYRDDKTSMQRDEARSHTAAHEQVVRKTDDGAQFSSTTSSSTSTSKFQQVSSTQEVPYVTPVEAATREDSTTREEHLTRENLMRDEHSRRVTNTTDYEQNLRQSNIESGELISRKVDYPDANTKVIVETRCLPDGTRVTSTRKEFRAPVHSTRSEQHSSKSETKSYSTSSLHRSDNRESSKATREIDIVDSQRQVDDHDFKRTRNQYLNQQDDFSQSQRTEQREQRSESKRFDTRESSSKITRETVDRQEVINQSQRREEDHDYKRNAQVESIRKDDINTKLTNQRIETKLNDTNQRETLTSHDKMHQQSDVSATHRTNRVDSKVDEVDRREILTTHDKQNIKQDVNETQYVESNDERIHNIVRDQKHEEIVEKRSSDQYQTTYQTDYTQKKISNDWSPTHQAWASTLRADTPTSTRPTTRASSPGTSSLRSSVSPDKSCRKPPSRGGSPNKIDRYSPSRYSTDRYSTTTSTQSLTETKTYKHGSPERKPPVSPTRHRSSPDRKPDGYRQRPSESPEKRPQDCRTYSSPDRKPAYQPTGEKPYPTSSNRSVSPEKKLPERPKDVPFTRPSTSPERKPGYQKPSSPSSPTRNYETSPTRPSTSPEPRKSGPKDSSPTKTSVSPDRTPGYMKPTAASKPADTLNRDTKSPTKHAPSLSPDRKSYGKSTVREDHYKFIDEETKMYTRTDRDDTRYTKKSSPSPDKFSGPRDKSPSAARKIPEESRDSPDYCRAESPSLRPTLRKDSRSPSPPKGPVTFTEDQLDKTKRFQSATADINTKYDEDITKTFQSSKPRDSPVRTAPREPSPSKIGTYDKKRSTEETEITTVTQDKTKDIRYDSVKRSENTTKRSDSTPTKKSPRDSVSPTKPINYSRESSPSKYGTYDKKRRSEETVEISTTTKITTDDKYDSLKRQKSDYTRKITDSPSSPTKKSPRESTSPVKSPTKDAKYKHTYDFIATERKAEDINKKTVNKDRPRQLLTPSTSPTRKPKTEEPEPSTGQSSPTTSVSGFVYFSSPKTEKTIITDLDDEEFFSKTNKTEDTITTTTYKRPESLNVERSPSPSKIPCRSPSPEKRSSPMKDSLPRKSSLKKPSTDNIALSPVEKPPSSFRISPSEETKDFPEHKVVKKDRPDKQNDSPAKVKPPFERRETYEERCLKILGVVDDTVPSEISKIEPKLNYSTESEPRETSLPLLGTYKDTKDTTKVNVSDFITREQEDTIEKRTAYFTTDKKPKTPSRDSSPTKLQDIISQKTVKKCEEFSTEDVEDEIKSQIIRQSPDRDIGYQKPRSSHSPEKKISLGHKDTLPAKSRQSPERKPGYQTSTDSPTLQYARTTSPSRPLPKESTPARSSVSPERKPGYQQPDKSSPTDKHTKSPSPSRSSVSPDKIPGYMRSTTATTKKFESATEDFQQNVTNTIRESVDKETGYQKPKATEPATKPKDSYKTRLMSPERKPGQGQPIQKSSPEKKKPDRSSVSPDRKPSYMRSTTATSTKYEEISTVGDTNTKGTTYKFSTPQQPSSRSSSPSKKLEEPKHARSPSPPKSVMNTTEESTILIQSEREQEILDRVQQSLRKLSPTRDQRSSSRERSPGKSTISLQDIDVITTETGTLIEEEDLQVTQKETKIKSEIPRSIRPKDHKPKDQKPPSKSSSRTVSPVKKPTICSPTKTEKIPESQNKSRSISPKKPVSPTERPQSPQVSRVSGIKPREPTPSSLTRKPSSGNTSPTKTEKVTVEIKKTTGVTKQNSFTKTSAAKTTTSKYTSPARTEPEPKRAPTPKGINKENVSPKKEDVKVTRTASDTTLKNKKASPQRMKSKPEIQVNDLSPTRITKTTFTKKSTTKDTQTKLAPKPKSATALNYPQDDDDDIIIDVEQAKSSRENSPDRICPTPVNFQDDVGTPRFPDEVKEPDDDFRQRTHHTIHETESIVDDIVEISEDDELFVKRTDTDRVTGSDDCLLSVTDKVSKFTSKIETITKPKDTTAQFKDVEKRVHSDFIDEKLKSDECLLSVSEKVNKFAKGPRDTNDKSPARRIVDEYDTQSTYQDDYTKLSVNDKAHLFVETAENVKASKTKPAQKVERPDLSNVDESLKSDECLLSVSDKVNKFVKTAEQFLSETHELEDKEKKVREQYDKFIKHIAQNEDDEELESQTTEVVSEETDTKYRKTSVDKTPSFAKETASSHSKVKDYASPNLKPTEKTPIVKITTLRSSEAVKKAKALFENIATSQQTKDTKTTKLMDIGVIKKSPKTDSTIVLHPSVEDFPKESECEIDSPYSKDRLFRPQHPDHFEEKPRSSPSRHTTQSPEVPRAKSPMPQSVKTTTTTTTKKVLSRYPAAQTEAPRHTRPEVDKPNKPLDKSSRYTPEPKQTRPEQELPQEKVPSYQRPTKTSQIKEEKTLEESEVTTRRGSGKFGVELRRTSMERSTLSSERRRSSVAHHQPTIEDVFDLDLLEQMLEKVVGYEMRRRIRAQIRVAKKKLETEHTDSYSKHIKQTTITKTRSPDRKPQTKSPERQKQTPQKTLSPERAPASQRSTPSELTQAKAPTTPMLNGHAKEPNNLYDKLQRPQSPEKLRSTSKTKSPVRQPSPEKKTRHVSPTKMTPKSKTNRFSEYASAYMKKVGLNESDKVRHFDKTKRTTEADEKTGVTKTTKKTQIEDHDTTQQFEEHRTVEMKTSSTSKSISERTSSKDTIEVIQVNGKRSPSPEKKRSPVRRVQSPSGRLHQRTPSPDFKRRNDLSKKDTVTKTVYETEPKVTTRETIIKTVYEEVPKVDISKKESIIKTVYGIEKKIPQKQAQEEKPSWITNRNLKKTSAESRSFTSRKVEEKKTRGGSPSKALTRTTDAVISSYGPGPLDADGRPLFGIKALRNGSSNYQVKGTVIRQEFHSRNGGEPEGTVSVTAYSTEPQELEKLLQAQGEKPSRIHGLAAITTTKKFGGDTGTTLREAHNKEDRAVLEQFTHSDRRISDVKESYDTRESREETLVDTKGIQTREERVRREGSEKQERRTEERRERVERREDRKTMRQGSVKSLTEKYIKSASDTTKSVGAAYPKAGLILRSTNMKDSVSSDSSTHAGLARTDSEHSLGSVEDATVVTSRTTTQAGGGATTTTTTTTRRGERSFLDSSTKVTGVQDILTRMKNADIVIQEGDTAEESEARALLNKFLGASVLMAGMQAYVTEKPTGHVAVKQETVRTTTSSSGPGKTRTTKTTSVRTDDVDLDQCWDEKLLRSLLEASTDYEQRRRIRARIRTLMAEQEACASAVTEALAAAESQAAAEGADDTREEEEVTVTSSVRRDSSEKTVSSSTTTKTSKVIENVARPAPKPVSPFAKFRQLEKQNSVNSPNSPGTPQSPGSKAPYFKFTDPALQASALTIKERLLQWCRDKTRDYENVKLENFSTSWADGLAFCALVHHFLPDAFDYSKLTPDKRRHNFTLAFKVADEKAGIYPLLDVDDMVAMRKPDWKCVFTYVQAIHRRFKDQQ
ncbi:titin isoform X2 [Pectinophora gossypiella]|uniref:titin isoform X2 n=1 Tax=Pectinophora gossypiella TaxID=13191 RepID=UPI00214E7787|nr:titin isoform X2 [Pectinophora gossypiella]